VGETLAIGYHPSPEGGKNAALNAAIGLAEGQLLLFTDDDVRFATDWVSTMWQGAQRWPEHTVFGGRVLVEWPAAGSSPFSPDSRYLGIAFTLLDPEWDEGPRAEFHPFGPNMAVRRSVVDAGLRFDPRLGPRPGRYVMGGETEFAERATDGGRPAVFLPGSVVHHTVRPAQYRLRWLLPRARRYGRLVAFRRAGAGLAPEGAPGGAPMRGVAALYGRVLRSGLSALARAGVGRRHDAFERMMDAGVDLGRLDYLRKRIPVLSEHGPP
jgi:GT2 family glycosyltransferase